MAVWILSQEQVIVQEEPRNRDIRTEASASAEKVDKFHLPY